MATLDISTETLTKTFNVLKSFRDSTRIWNSDLFWEPRSYNFIDKSLIFYHFGLTHKAEEIIIDNFNSMLKNGKFKEIDQLLEEIPLNYIPNELIILLMSNSFHPEYKDKINNKGRFYEKAKSELKSRKG